MFETIVVAIDGSTHSDKALTMACNIVGKYGSDLYLVHAPQLETAGIAVGSGAVEIRPGTDLVAEAAKTTVDVAANKAVDLGCTPADVIVGTDDPAASILRVAQTVGADLIVMGRRGLGGVAGLLLGSVSQKVSHQAQCTCMTVHA